GHALAAYRVDDQPHLARRGAHVLGGGPNFHSCSLPRLARFVGVRVAAEQARGGELAQLVADHVLGDVDGHVAAPIVHADGVADEVGEDGRVARPGLDHALLGAAVHGLDAAEQTLVDVRSFLDGSAHRPVPLFLTIILLVRLLWRVFWYRAGCLQV